MTQIHYDYNEHYSTFIPPYAFMASTRKTLRNHQHSVYDSTGFYRLHVLGLPSFRLAIFVHIVSEISSDSPTSATQGKPLGSPVFSLLLDQQYFSHRLLPTL